MDYMKKINELVKDGINSSNAEEIVNLINDFNNNCDIDDATQEKLRKIHEEAFDLVIEKYTK